MTVDIDQIRKRRGLSQDVLDAAYNELLRELPLAALRSDVGVTQSEMASRLGVSQAAVSKLEGRGDFLVSTLQRYVDAVGGTLEVAIRAADKCYQLIKSADEKGPLFRLDSDDGALVQAWQHLQYQPAQRPSELWTKRSCSVEEVDVFAAFAASANEFEQLEAA